MSKTKTSVASSRWESVTSSAFHLYLLSPVEEEVDAVDVPKKSRGDLSNIKSNIKRGKQTQTQTNTAESLRTDAQTNKTSWTLTQRETRLGSHFDNEVCLCDSAVSRFHAHIEMDSLGHRLIDHESKNGVFINGIRVKDAYLTHGVELKLGNSRLRYTISQTHPIKHLFSTQTSFGKLIGHSMMMRELFALLNRVSQTDMTLLIEGESGTGKELAASAVHEHSSRTDGPFVIFDCSAIPPTLIESELFGHRKGSFTGATQDRVGAFQRAENGTLFLDEIGELPLSLQSRLLRALERREIKPVGDDQYREVNVRVIAATNRHLKQEVDEGQFRLDLYYRLAVL